MGTYGIGKVEAPGPKPGALVTLGDVRDFFARMLDALTGLIQMGVVSDQGERPAYVNKGGVYGRYPHSDGPTVSSCGSCEAARYESAFAGAEFVHNFLNIRSLGMRLEKGGNLGQVGLHYLYIHIHNFILR